VIIPDLTEPLIPDLTDTICVSLCIRFATNNVI